jgi:hypothetical protein
MRFHLLPDPWLETEVAHLEDASAVDFKVVFFLEAGRHRFLVEILVFGARPSDTYISLHSPAGYGKYRLATIRVAHVLFYFYSPTSRTETRCMLSGSLVVHVRATREVRMARPFGQGSRVW